VNDDNFFSGNTGRDVIHPLSASTYQENVLDLGSVVVKVEFSGGHPPLMDDPRDTLSLVRLKHNWIFRPL